MNICIADNLKILRHKYGYTLESVAEIISVSRQTVAKWEAGDSYPDIVNCIKLAKLFKISLDELVNAPIEEIINNQFVTNNDRICGIVNLNDDNSVVIPQQIMQMFDIYPGQKMLLLAERKQGIALVKCSQF